LADVAYTLLAGRREFKHRRMVVCRDAGDAADTLAARDAKRVFTRAAGRENPPVVFLFPGQGAQQVQMASEIYRDEPVFREHMDACAEMLAPHLGLDLRSVLYPDA